MDRAAADPRRLLPLSEVARHGSFSRAAEALALTQPAVSQQVAALERQLGLRLLDRAGGGGKGGLATAGAGAERRGGPPGGRRPSPTPTPSRASSSWLSTSWPSSVTRSARTSGS